MHYEIAVAGLITLLAMYQARRRSCTVRHISGPSSPSWVFGHMLQLMLPTTYGQYEFDWQKRHGLVYRLKGCFGQDRLMVSDPTAMQYILNSPHFKFGPGLENAAELLYGKGSVMCANAQDHKRLRAALNVGFSAAAVRNYIPVFEKAVQAATYESSPSNDSNVPSSCIGMFDTGSGRRIYREQLPDNVDASPTQFFLYFQHVFQCPRSKSICDANTRGAIANKIPSVLVRAASYLPTPTFRAIRRAKYISDQLGNRVVQEKKNAAERGMEINTDVFGQLGERGKITLNEDEIVAQTAIIMIAGQDTTATTLSFGLAELAKAPDFQDKLRAEIHSALGSAGNNGVVYESMPLLNAFIKESLRMYPAEAISERVAVEDTTIPLTEVIATSTGEHMAQVIVGKGQIVSLAIASYQRLESRWGKDAHQFNPTRWLDGEVLKGTAVGPYANRRANSIA
ncbi:cytochrome P450 [Mycena galopus ATCC 62051]|nr:cytochrome P450 [Mycena galopus ATCC 62051]